MELRLFRVKMFYTDPELSMLLTHGGHSGGVHTREVFVPAESREDAISKLWKSEEEEAKQQMVRNADILKRQKEGRAFEIENMLVHYPSDPVDRARWQAAEIKIKGYKISVTEDSGLEEEKKPQGSPKHKKWWQRICG